MKEGKLEKNEIALPKKVESSVQLLDFKLDSSNKTLVITAEVKIDITDAQFENQEPKAGNYVFLANRGSLASGASPEICFATTADKNTVKLIAKEILTRGFKHTGGG